MIRPLDTIHTPVGAWIRYADEVEVVVRELREYVMEHHKNNEGEWCSGLPIRDGCDVCARWPA